MPRTEKRRTSRLLAALRELRRLLLHHLVHHVGVGGGKTRIDMWDGAKWVPQSDWTAAYTDVVDQVVKEQSAEFAKSGK